MDHRTLLSNCNTANLVHFLVYDICKQIFSVVVFSYCSQLKPDTHHRKYKTGIKWQSLNPLFNEEFVFDTKMTELQQKTLVITVWDKDHGKSNDYLGM